MAVSGVFTFDPNRDEIIEGALRRIGVLGVGQSASADQLSVGEFELNLLAKGLQNEGIMLWTREWTQQTLTASSHVVNDSKYYKCLKSHTSGATNEPGTGADWRTYWYEVGDVSATAWALSTAYTSIGQFSLPAGTVGLEKVYYRDIGNNDFDIELVTFNDYLSAAYKRDVGRPTMMALEFSLNTRTAYMYPQPDSTDYIINFNLVRRVYDYTTGADTSDFEQNWIPVLINGLAERLSHVYSLPLQERQLLYSSFKDMLSMAKAQNIEWESTDMVEPGWGASGYHSESYRSVK